jgi:hypothetical protein
MAGQQGAFAAVATKCRIELDGAVISLLATNSAMRDQSLLVVWAEFDKSQLAYREVHAERNAFRAEAETFIFPCAPCIALWHLEIGGIEILRRTPCRDWPDVGICPSAPFF